jgi:hypothetical protein
MLGSSNNDRQLQKRHKMLRRELSNLDWNGFVVRDVLEVHVCTLIVSFRNFRVLGRFRTGLDQTEFGLVRPSLSSFDVSCHEFCTGFHFAA